MDPDDAGRNARQQSHLGDTALLFGILCVARGGLLCLYLGDLAYAYKPHSDAERMMPQRESQLQDVVYTLYNRRGDQSPVQVHRATTSGDASRLLLIRLRAAFTTPDDVATTCPATAAPHIVT